jgi:hypothetical protein
VLLVVVFVDRVERVAVVEHRLALIIDPPDIPVMLVIDDGPGGRADSIPRQPEPPAQVDILIEEEVILVKTSDLIENLSPDHHRPTARNEDVPFAVVLAGCLAPTKLEPESSEGRSAGDEIDALTVPAQDLAGRGGNIGRVGENANQFLQPSWIRTGVVVEKGDDLLVELRHGVVVAASEAEILFGPDQASVGKAGPHEIGGAIRRAVIHHDDLTRTRIGLRLQRCQAFLEMVATVPVEHDDGH